MGLFLVLFFGVGGKGWWCLRSFIKRGEGCFCISWHRALAGRSTLGRWWFQQSKAWKGGFVNGVVFNIILLWLGEGGMHRHWAVLLCG